ncbi:MAG: hypothetical protein GX096_12025, partial [Clostridiales bacterium]|nr:hypothetical protein [Clostridiales bacterium]
LNLTLLTLDTKNTVATKPSTLNVPKFFLGHLTNNTIVIQTAISLEAVWTSSSLAVL